MQYKKRLFQKAGDSFVRLLKAASVVCLIWRFNYRVTRRNVASCSDVRGCFVYCVLYLTVNIGRFMSNVCI